MWPDLFSPAWHGARSAGSVADWMGLCLVLAGAVWAGRRIQRSFGGARHSASRARVPLRMLCGVGVLFYAAVAGVFYWRHGWTPVFFGAFVAAGMLLALALIDARTSLLPDALTLPLLWLGLAIAWLGGPVSLDDAVAGAMVGYGLLWLLFQAFRAVRGRDGMGYGDFKLLAALGAWLGPHPALLALLAACLGGLLFACVRQKTWRPAGAYPFGPFLALAGAGFMLAQCALSG
ncbi:MAG TPA: A24 family peptidase [Burkholderiaceae bacterium]|nr:A24 family peptidase [Burkholderiaceae bacterium]